MTNSDKMRKLLSVIRSCETLAQLKIAQDFATTILWNMDTRGCRRVGNRKYVNRVILDRHIIITNGTRCETRRGTPIIRLENNNV